ncbi:MAG TPA: hypothetical protein PKM72_12855 [Nitrospirales bacterium]|nr:hypothetical protein [Nitrospirales bacterium]
MKKVKFPFLYILVLFNVCAGIQFPVQVNGQPHMAKGIQPLIQLEGQSLHQLIPRDTRPLLLPEEQEAFLQELEGHPPDWPTLQSPDHTEQSKRLFQLNRARDEARLIHKNILQKPIAFLWSGFLRQYMPEYEGYSVALGPELTSTSWGIVRFKPVGLPDYLVAIPSLELVTLIRRQQQTGKQIAIGILFFGTLVADESLIYSFSHDQKGDGMILPVVQIEGVRYFLFPPNPSSSH